MGLKERKCIFTYFFVSLNNLELTSIKSLEETGAAGGRPKVRADAVSVRSPTPKSLTA